MIEEAIYTEAKPITLERGDIILIGTDGVWEASNPANEMFGKQRLREVIRRCAGDSPRSICESVIAAVKDFSETNRQEDDITLVIIKVL